MDTDRKPPKATQADRTAAAKAKLLEATVALIAEKGVDGFSIADVAQRAGVSRGLPRHHFGMRDDLVLEAAKVAAPRLELSSEVGLKPLLNWLETQIQPPKDRRTFLRAFVSLSTNNGSPPAVDAYIRTWWEEAARAVGGHLDAGVKAGVIRGGIDTGAYARALVASLLGQLVLVSRGKLADADADANAFVSMLSMGLAPGKPPSAKSRAPSASIPQPGLFG